MSSLASVNRRNGLLFCLPWLIGLTVFLLYPLLAAFYYSLCDYSVLLPPVFVGLDNYVALLHDSYFWNAVENTLGIWILSTVPQLLLALGIAYLLNSRLRV